MDDMTKIWVARKAVDPLTVLIFTNADNEECAVLGDDAVPALLACALGLAAYGDRPGERPRWRVDFPLEWLDLLVMKIEGMRYKVEVIEM